MTDRRRRQKENRTARKEAEKKAETRKEVLRRIGFALLMGTALVLAFVALGVFGGGDGSALPGTYEAYRQQPTACGAEAPPSEEILTFETFEEQSDITADTTVTATVRTSCGAFVIDLDPASSPQTVHSFVFLARQGFYDGTVFHRIYADFVFQGGDPSANGTGGPGYRVPDEFPAPGFVFEPGVVAMANSGRGTTGSQFFVVIGEQASALTNSFNVLGRVTSGEEALELIGAVPTATRPNSVERSLPLETVYIEGIDIDVG